MRTIHFFTAAFALGMTGAAWAQSFTYQGVLNDGSGPADGLYNLSFKLFDSESAGNQVGGTLTQNGFDVVEGLFTSELDFGAGAFNGADRWLEVGVNGTTLSPRTPITPAPMSMFSMRPWVTSGTSLSYTAGNIGVGTSSPLAKLHVGGGDIRLDGGRELFFADNGQIRCLDDAHRILFRRAENKMELREFGDLVFSPGATTGAETAKVVMLANGNVGIGTAAPQAHLHVAGGELALDDQGTIRGLGRLHVQSNENLFLNPFAGDSYVGFGGGPGNLYVGGDVGVGTSTPRRKLEVNGDIQMSGARTKLFYKGDFNDGTHTGSMGFYTANGGQTAIMTPYDSDGDVLSNSTLSLGGFGAFDSSTVGLSVSGNVGIGTTAPAAKLDVNGTANFNGEITAPSAAIPTLNGNVTVAGEMTAQVVTITGGSDVAEPYEVAAAGEVQPQPGMVVAIDSSQIGRMRVACRAYDTTVAGILSGANGISPGITLRQKGTIADGALPVASIGRVWCWCDANAGGPIEAGDMLTTCGVPGHAMKVTDFGRANGSVIGKAMSPLKSGRGLVLVLVSLK